MLSQLRQVRQASNALLQGTQLQDGKIVTSGGRVMCVVGLADTVRGAQQKAYEAIIRSGSPLAPVIQLSDSVDLWKNCLASVQCIQATEIDFSWPMMPSFTVTTRRRFTPHG